MIGCSVKIACGDFDRVYRADFNVFTGYQSHIEPCVTAMFEAAALRIGHSMVPPGFYVRLLSEHF